MKRMLLTIGVFVAVFTLFTTLGFWLLFLSGEPIAPSDAMFQCVGLPSFIGFMVGGGAGVATFMLTE